MAPNNDTDNKEVEEQAMEEGKAVTKKEKAVTPKPKEASNKNSLLIWLVGAIAVLVVLALAIGIPVGLMKNNSSSSNEESTSSATMTTENKQNTTTEPTTEPTTATTTERKLPVVSARVLKETYSSCSVLSSDLEIAARMLANKTIESNIDMYFRNKNDVLYTHAGGPFVAMPMRMESGAVAEVASTADQGSSVSAGSGGNIATTESSFESNNQEEGVEEPDAVKSDGVSVFAAYGPEIVKISVDNADIVSRTKLPADEKCNLDTVSSMLLVDDTLVVISNGWCNDDDWITPAVEPRSFIYYPRGQSLTRVILFDKETMEVKGEPQDIKGSYNSARAIGKDVYIVTTKSIDYHSKFTNKLNIWDSTIFGKDFDDEEYRSLAGEKVDEAVDSFVTDLVDELGDCGSVQRLALFQNELTDSLPPYGGIMESISTVTGFNVDTPETKSSKSLILPHSGWQVYSSQSQLVLAAQGWWFGNGASQETYVVTYSLDNAEATVMGFGTVPGYVLNQFSIDHQSKNGKDYLLFATTTRERWNWILADSGARTWEPQTESTSQITILEVPSEEGLDKMEVVGKVEGLGKPGEQIFSVRFQDNRAFVVTFEQTDPFYTIDVTDPTNPKQVGELEIPGFSSYLHPIGENLIMGVGQYVDPDNGRREGLQISIFDVSDFANPEQIHTYTETSGDGSGSQAEYDHMAFRYLDETGLLILPVSIYDWARDPDDDAKPFNGFKVYKADEEGIEEYLSVNHETRDYYYYRYCWRNYRGSLATRSLVFSGVLWTMQRNAIQLSDLSTRVVAGEPIDLDEGIDDAVSCRPPIIMPLAEPIDLPAPIPIDEVDAEAPVDEEESPFAHCAAISCLRPECDTDLITPEGECCPICPEKEAPIDCSVVQCAQPDCGEQEPIVPDGQCCGVCPGDEAE